ncbi:MAG: peptidylprolyl isomerase [Planctomycetes bacterium]|nr:peptidylprolyl isomerase [Planctomycetota bacterium]
MPTPIRAIDVCSAALCGCVGLASSLGPLAGCSSGKSAARQNAVSLTTADFAQDGAAAPAPLTRPMPLRDTSALDQQATARGNSADGYTVTTGTPAPPLPAADVTTVGLATVIDSKVGDINGRAIYASAFLEDMGARMRAQAMEFGKETMARRMNPIESRAEARAAWEELVKKIIKIKLENELETELLRAEAAASFTPEQKQGFVYFMQSVQRDLYSDNRGSRSIAGEKLNAEDGQTIDEYLKNRELRELVGFQLARKVYRRINISWRDIQLEYDKRTELYSPPPRATFRLILPAEGATPESIESRLKAGESFATLAEDPKINSYLVDKGGVEERTFKTKQADSDLFGPPDVNAAARTLKPGEWAGPLKAGRGVAFVFLETLEIAPSDLYGLQLKIEDALRRRKGDLARERYIDRLKERASFTSLDDMTDSLAAFSVKRYFEPGFDEGLAAPVESESTSPNMAPKKQ